MQLLLMDNDIFFIISGNNTNIYGFKQKFIRRCRVGSDSRTSQELFET